MLQSFEFLQKLEITNNQLTSQSLETISYLFQECQEITHINLSSNYIGGSSSEKTLVDFFLYKLFTELIHPVSLNLSYNLLTDDSLAPICKYIFANYESRMEYFNLENNRMSPFANRTIMKAYSLSPSRETLKFKFGAIPLSVENMQAGLSDGLVIKRKSNNFW